MIHVMHLPVERHVLDLIHDAAADATLVKRDGAGPGSLTDDGLCYYVAGGVLIHHRYPALWQWARDLAVEASRVSGERLELSRHQPSAVNVNVLNGEATEYELHTDSYHWTLLVMASGSHLGGELEVMGDLGSFVTVAPSPGMALLFNGDQHPHAVRPLRDGTPRVSVPIAFTPVGVPWVRNEELDQHLYTP